MNRIKQAIASADFYDFIFFGFLSLMYVWAMIYTWYFFESKKVKPAPMITNYAIGVPDPVRQTFTDQNPILEN